MPEGAAFDGVRAAVNLVLSSVLIVIGTNYKLPLSTTYVTFMVVWVQVLPIRLGNESAVFRVTGVLTVIGGWFITAAVAFLSAAVVCALMYYIGFVAMFAFMALAIFVVVKSNFFDKKKDDTEVSVATSDSDSVAADSFEKKVANQDSQSMLHAVAILNDVVDAFFGRRVRALRRVGAQLEGERRVTDRNRRIEMQEFGKFTHEAAKQGDQTLLDSGLWLQLGIDCRAQYIKALRQMHHPVLDHVDNGFNPLPKEAVKEFAPVRREVVELFSNAAQMVQSGDFSNYETIRLSSAAIRKELKSLRHNHMNRLQNGESSKDFKVIMVYINLLRETQNLVNILRHHIEAVKCFNSPATVSEEEKAASADGEY